LHAPRALGSNGVLRSVGVLRNIVVLRSMRTIGRVSYACECNCVIEWVVQLVFLMSWLLR
jgi:hypothetical protein